MQAPNYTDNFNYPERVSNYAMSIINVLEVDQFFHEEEIDPAIFFENLCEKVLKNWLASRDLELTEDEMIDVIANSATQSVLEVLKNKGMLDSIQDENGEDRFFLTADGREIADFILEEEKNNDNTLNENNDLHIL